MCLCHLCHLLNGIPTLSPESVQTNWTIFEIPLILYTIGDQFILYDQAPGKYRVVIKLDTTPNQDCPDPDCERWLPGLYKFQIGM